MSLIRALAALIDASRRRLVPLYVDNNLLGFTDATFDPTAVVQSVNAFNDARNREAAELPLA